MSKIIFYLDTNPILDLLYKTRENHDEIKNNFLDEYKSNKSKYNLIISQFTINETFHSLKDIESRRELIQQGYSVGSINPRIDEYKSSYEYSKNKQIRNRIYDLCKKHDFEIVPLHENDIRIANSLMILLNLQSYDSIHLSILLRQIFVNKYPGAIITNDGNFIDCIDRYKDIFQENGVYMKTSNDFDDFEGYIEGIETKDHKYLSPVGMAKKLKDKIIEEETSELFPDIEEEAIEKGMEKVSKEVIDTEEIK